MHKESEKSWQVFSIKRSPCHLWLMHHLHLCLIQVDFVNMNERSSLSTSLPASSPSISAAVGRTLSMGPSVILRNHDFKHLAVVFLQVVLLSIWQQFAIQLVQGS